MTAETILTQSSNSNGSTTQSHSWLPWIVCFSGALFFFYEFIQMQFFNAITPDLMRDFSLTASQLSLLSSTHVAADALFCLPAGMLLDRFSTRTIILYSMFFCILSTFIFATTHSLWVASACHFLTGVGNAFCFLSCIVLATRWFPPKRLAFIVGMVVTIAFLGGMMAQAPTALLTQSVGWRNALLLDGLIGIAIYACIWYFVTDCPKNDVQKRQKEREEIAQLGFWTSFKMAVQNMQNWYCGIYTSFLNLPIMVLSALWGGYYLNQVHNLSMTQATTITSMIFVGSIIGAPLAGWYSDKIGQRRKPMLAGGVLSLFAVAAIIFLPHLGFTQLMFWFFALGFFTSTQIIAYPMVAEGNPTTITGTAIAISSTLIMAGGAIAQVLFGKLMDLNWDHQILNQIPIYSPANFHLAMLIFPVAFIIAILMMLRAKETFAKSSSEPA